MDALEKGESEGPTVDPFEENTQDSAEKDRENLERILDELATKANRASAELDEVNAEIAGIKEEIKRSRRRNWNIRYKRRVRCINRR